MADNFVSYDRDTLFLMPPSLQDWLPEDHLARFVVDLVSQLDLRQIRDSYAGRGSAAYHPEMLIALLSRRPWEVRRNFSRGLVPAVS